MAFDRSVVGKTFGPYDFQYDWQRVSLYALAVGAQADELPLITENHGPKVLPTFSVVAARQPLIEALTALGGNFATLVHGAQKCTVHREAPPEAKLKSTSKITGLYDKGKGALGVFDTQTFTSDGALLFETTWQIFFRGEGGFGGERGPEAPPYNPPEGKAADARLEMKTLETQALLYRLAGGDMNPIHSSPEFAQAVGFPRPILHGLCTFGFAARAAVKALAGGDANKVTSIEGRFSKPVLPGDTIVTEIWKIAPGEAYFGCSVKERNEAVLSLGRVTYHAT